MAFDLGTGKGEIGADAASPIEREEPELEPELGVDEDVQLKNGKVNIGIVVVIGLELQADPEMAADPEVEPERSQPMVTKPVLDKRARY